MRHMLYGMSTTNNGTDNAPACETASIALPTATRNARGKKFNKLRIKVPYYLFIKANQMTPEEAERTRYANFYNNYNIDWHSESQGSNQSSDPRKGKCAGVTTDGKSPCCPNKKVQQKEDKGCPTGTLILHHYRVRSISSLE